MYYQIDYELIDVDERAGYLHAQWRRSNPLPYRQVHTILDGDPVRFRTDIRVTVQALGWRPEGRYLPLRDDISSTAWWYGVTAEGAAGTSLESGIPSAPATKAEHARCASILNVTFDCANARAQAEFWAAGTGWTAQERDVTPGHIEYAVVPSSEGTPALYFTTVISPPSRSRKRPRTGSTWT